jgi:hypothetical protein
VAAQYHADQGDLDFLPMPGTHVVPLPRGARGPADAAIHTRQIDDVEFNDAIAERRAELIGELSSKAGRFRETIPAP